MESGARIGDMEIDHLSGYLVVAETHYPTRCMLLTANAGVPQFGIRAPLSIASLSRHLRVNDSSPRVKFSNDFSRAFQKQTLESR
jgi:hypothetical protein